MTPRRALPWRLACLVAGLALCAPLAAAQEGGPWKLEEAVGAPDGLDLSGSIRPRYEYLSDPFTAGRVKADSAVSVQTLLKAGVKHGDFALEGELADARLIDHNRGGGVTAAVDTLEIINAYVAWRPKNVIAKGDALDLGAGRFTQDVGSRRLVARTGFGNTFQSFEGVRGVWKNAQDLQVTAFAMAPLVREPDDIPSLLDNEAADNETPDDVVFSGLHLQAPLKGLPGGGATAEAYVLHLDESDDARIATRNRDLTTWGVRLKRGPKAKVFDFDVEYVRQTGSSRASTSPADVFDLDHEADMLHLEAGYTFDAPWKPRVSAHYDHASGDKAPGDARNERFDPLFGDRSFELGPTSIYGFVLRSNLDSPGIRIEAAPDDRQDVMAMVRVVKLDKARDSYGSSNVRDPTGASGDNAGTQIELRYRRWLVKDALRLQVGGAYVWEGEFFERAPNRTPFGDPAYGYAMVTWTF